MMFLTNTLPVTDKLNKTIKNLCELVQGTLLEGELSTVNLLIKVACFIKKVSHVCITKSNLFKRVVQGGQLC
jgi:hypothetical protein